MRTVLPTKIPLNLLRSSKAATRYTAEVPFGLEIYETPDGALIRLRQQHADGSHREWLHRYTGFEPAIRHAYHLDLVDPETFKVLRLILKAGARDFKGTVAAVDAQTLKLAGFELRDITPAREH